MRVRSLGFLLTFTHRHRPLLLFIAFAAATGFPFSFCCARPILIPFLLVVGNSCCPGGPLLPEACLVLGFTVLTLLYE